VGYWRESRDRRRRRDCPGNEFNGSAVDLPNATLDFFPPSLLGAGIDRLIQTANQGLDQCSAGFQR